LLPGGEIAHDLRALAARLICKTMRALGLVGLSQERNFARAQREATLSICRPARAMRQINRQRHGGLSCAVIEAPCKICSIHLRVFQPLEGPAHNQRAYYQ
jgi:hypothetical protein